MIIANTIVMNIMLIITTSIISIAIILAITIKIMMIR